MSSAQMIVCIGSGKCKVWALDIAQVKLLIKLKATEVTLFYFFTKKKKKIEQANISYYYKQVFGFKYSN